MAILVRPDGTEAVLDRLPRRKALRDSKLLVYAGWWFLQQNGIKLADIARIANRAVSTVSVGIRAYSAHLREIKAVGRNDLGPVLPLLGFLPLVPTEPTDEPCQRCGGHIDSDRWVCVECHAVSDTRQARLDHRTVADSTRDYRAEANRTAAGEPDVKERKAWEDREAAARKAEAKGVKVRRRSPKKHADRMAK